MESKFNLSTSFDTKRTMIKANLGPNNGQRISKVGEDLLKSYQFKKRLEEIIVDGLGRSASLILFDIYDGIKSIWGQQEIWPKSIKNFYGSLNKVLSNEEIYDESRRDDRIYNMVKNKFLSLSNVSFKN